MLKTIEAYFHSSPENMIELGKEAGMTDKAADYFWHFSEIKVSLLVDIETGEVKTFVAGVRP